MKRVLLVLFMLVLIGCIRHTPEELEQFRINSEINANKTPYNQFFATYSKDLDLQPNLDKGCSRFTDMEKSVCYSHLASSAYSQAIPQTRAICESAPHKELCYLHFADLTKQWLWCEHVFEGDHCRILIRVDQCKKYSNYRECLEIRGDMLATVNNKYLSDDEGIIALYQEMLVGNILDLRGENE